VPCEAESQRCPEYEIRIATDAVNERCKPPLMRNEVQTIARSGARYRPKQPVL
jgi:hypothetical protein